MLQAFREEIELALQTYLQEKKDSPLFHAAQYVLCQKGKRIRPLLVCLIADALGEGCDVMPAALGVEFFHTASLIADDLPCMDNELFRRGEPTLHKAFSESTSILTSFALIAAGYGSLAENQKLLERKRGKQNASTATFFCLRAASEAGGFLGAPAGQYVDLSPPDRALATLEKVFYQKTVTLFEMTFYFGWLFGGGNPTKLEDVRALAYDLGMAFQLTDDLQDFEEDREREGLNLAVALGKEKAIQLFEERTASLEKGLKSLNLFNAPFAQLFKGLLQRFEVQVL